MAKAAGLYTQDRDPQTGLTRRQREVLEKLTEQGKSQLEAAGELGLSRQRVRQIVVGLIELGYEIPNAKSPKPVVTETA